MAEGHFPARRWGYGDASFLIRPRDDHPKFPPPCNYPPTGDQVREAARVRVRVAASRGRVDARAQRNDRAAPCREYGNSCCRGIVPATATPPLGNKRTPRRAAPWERERGPKGCQAGRTSTPRRTRAAFRSSPNSSTSVFTEGFRFAIRSSRISASERTMAGMLAGAEGLVVRVVVVLVFASFSLSR